MVTIRNTARLAMVLVLCSLAMPLAAKPPAPPPSQPDLTTLVNQVLDELAALQSDVDAVSTAIDNVQADLNAVSSELGTRKSVFFHSSQFSNDWQTVVTASVPDKPARFTVTASYYQEEIVDYAVVYVSYDGLTWNVLATLDPQPEGGDSNYAGVTTYTATVVARRIRIESFNASPDLGGNAPTVAWGISAVGSQDSGQLICKVEVEGEESDCP